MTDEKKRDILRASPAFHKVDINGIEFEFAYGEWGRDLAKAQGMDPLDEEHDGFKSFIAQIWSGMLPFDPDLKYEDVAHIMTYEDVMKLKPLLSFGLDDVAEGKPEAVEPAKAEPEMQITQNGVMEPEAA